MYFLIVLKNVTVMMAYLLIGILMIKSKKALTAHAKSVSTLLIYVCGPCMVMNSFLNMTCTRENNINVLSFFAVSLALQAIFFGLIYIFVRKKLEESKYRILAIGSVMGNVGFLGLPLVTAVFPGEPVVAAFSSVYTMSMNVIVFSIGVYMITGERKYMSVKSMILNPTTLAILAAMPLYLTGTKLPAVVMDSVGLFAKMTTPICMIVLGMRLAAVNFKDLISRPFAYVTCLMKLIVYPLFAYGIVKFLPFFSDTYKISILVLSAVPTAAIVLSLAEIHEKEQELAANVVLLSTLLSVITIPLVMLLV